VNNKYLNINTILTSCEKTCKNIWLLNIFYTIFVETKPKTMKQKITFYAIFDNGDKILFDAISIKSAKSFKTKYAKLKKTYFIQGGHSYTLATIGENIKEYKKLN